MAQSVITDSQQRCVSRCILTHWSEHSTTEPSQREEKYQACLNDCHICA